MEPINLDTTYLARVIAPDSNTYYLAIWVDNITSSMTDQYSTLHVTTFNGDTESFYFKGYVPPEEIPPDLQSSDNIMLDLAIPDCQHAAPAPAIDPAALNEFLS